MVVLDIIDIVVVLVSKRIFGSFIEQRLFFDLLIFIILVEDFVIGDFWFNVGDTNDSNFGHAMLSVIFISSLWTNDFRKAFWFTNVIQKPWAFGGEDMMAFYALVSLNPLT